MARHAAASRVCLPVACRAAQDAFVGADVGVALAGGVDDVDDGSLRGESGIQAGGAEAEAQAVVGGAQDSVEAGGVERIIEQRIHAEVAAAIGAEQAVPCAAAAAAADEATREDRRAAGIVTFRALPGRVLPDDRVEEGGCAGDKEAAAAQPRGRVCGHRAIDEFRVGLAQV